MKVYLAGAIILAVGLLNLFVLLPWLISQPNDLAVAIGCIDLVLAPLYGWASGTYLFKLTQEIKK